MLRNIDALPKKSLGQNFCTDPNILRKIADAMMLESGETVVEIGAGTGALTRLLAEKGDRLHAIEIDQRFAPLLQSAFSDRDHVRLHFDDALKILPTVLDALAEPAVLVGNLPYHISSQLVIAFLENRRKIKRAIITLQLEMAQRLCAQPGTKDFGSLSVRVQAAAETKLLFKIKPTCFYPEPEVTSACMRIDFTKPSEPQPYQEAIFVRVVKAGFAQRRKQLRNALSGPFSAVQVEEALSTAEIDPRVRAETLSIRQWIRLSDAFHEMAGKT